MTLTQENPAVGAPRKVRFVPKTGHEKNRIRQHGEIWTVVGEEHERLLLQSLEKTFKGAHGKEHDLRWVNKTQCENLQ